MDGTDNLDDFPDIPLDNFGAETNVAAQPAEEPKTAPDAKATGSEATQEAQPAEAEDNSKAESSTSEQATEQQNSGEDANRDDASQAQTGRPEKKDRVQARFDEMTRKNYEQAEYIRKLEEQTARFEAMRGVQPLQPDENGFIDPQALQQNIDQRVAAQIAANQAVVNQRIEREQIAQRIDHEGAEIESKFKDYLDADPIHGQTIREMVEERVNDNLYNTAALKQISPLKIAEKYFAGVAAAEKKAQAKAQQNLRTLQAESAVTQTGSAQVDDPDSLDALEARVADIKF